MQIYVYRCPDCPNRVSLAEDVQPYCTSPVADHCRTMVRVNDTDMVLLPLDAEQPRGRMEPGGNGVPRYIPLKVSHLKDAGILLPETQHALEWLYRHRETNGMAEAFSKVGGRRCIDLVAFARLMRERRE